MTDYAWTSSIGARVRMARQDAAVTAVDVARLLSLSVEDFQAAEDGDVRFTAQQLVEICRLLNKRPSWFFEQVLSENVVGQDR